MGGTLTTIITPVQILTGRVDQESAYLVDDYPYGRILRCKIRYWIETAVKGAKKGQQRFVYQTTNPKRPGDPWNKPHPGQYDLMVFLYLDDIEHVQHIGVGYWVSPEFDARLRLMGIVDHMSPAQRGFYGVLIERSQKYADPWEKWERDIDKIAAYITTTGNDPEPVNGFWEQDGRRIYLTEYDLPVYLTTARKRMA